MDKKANTGHNQKHDQRELIQIEGEVRAEIAGANPLSHDLDVWKIK